MKERTTNKPNKPQRKNKWKPQYDADGTMTFEVCGVVQKVKQGKTLAGDCDFVEFTLENPYVDGNYNTISVEVYHNLPQLEPGDDVTVKGNIRSWWDADMQRVLYSFVAEQVDDYVAESIDDDIPQDVYTESEYQRQNEEYRRKRCHCEEGIRRMTSVKHPWEE